MYDTYLWQCSSATPFRGAKFVVCHQVLTNQVVPRVKKSLRNTGMVWWRNSASRSNLLFLQESIHIPQPNTVPTYPVSYWLHKRKERNTLNPSFLDSFHNITVNTSAKQYPLQLCFFATNFDVIRLPLRSLTFTLDVVIIRRLRSSQKKSYNRHIYNVKTRTAQALLRSPRPKRHAVPMFHFSK
jgi:hypothetical protein